MPKVLEDFGRLDLLVNNASVFYRHDIDELTDRHWQEMIQLHILAPFKLSMAARAPLALEGGQIINIADIWGLRPRAKMLAYSVTKAAMIALTYALADAMAPQIRVNAIAPGFFLTQQNHFLLFDTDENLTERGASIISHTPMARFGKPEELAGACIWLASDASKFVSGIVVPIDGGFSAFSGV